MPMVLVCAFGRRLRMSCLRLFLANPREAKAV